MSNRKPRGSKMTVLADAYRQSLSPRHVSDVFEDIDHERLFEALVQEEIRSLPEHVRKFTETEYEAAVKRFSAQLPAPLKTLYVRISDHEGNEEFARADVAFRLGLEVGRILCGGAR